MNLVTIHNVLPDGQKIKFGTDGFVHGDVVYQFLKEKNIKGITQSPGGFAMFNEFIMVNYTIDQIDVI